MIDRIHNGRNIRLYSQIQYVNYLRASDEEQFREKLFDHGNIKEPKDG
jgi:hypothetical protein